MDPRPLLVGDLDAFRGEVHQDPLRSRRRSEHRDVADVGLQEPPQVVAVAQVVVRHHDRERSLVRRGGGAHLRRLLDANERVRLGIPFLAEERGPIVDHDRVPADRRRGSHERDRVVARAAHHEAKGRLEHFDEGANRAGKGADLGAAGGEELFRGHRGLSVDIGVAERAVDLRLVLLPLR